MLKIKNAKKSVKANSAEERFREAKVRIVMKVRSVSREKALAILSVGDSSSVDSGKPPVTPAAMLGKGPEEFICADELFDA